MATLVDLSQEIFHKAPVLPSFPATQVLPYLTHEEIDGETATGPVSNCITTLIMCDHASTHVDAFSHFHAAPARRGDTIDKLPLDLFYTPGICVNVTGFEPNELIFVRDVEKGLAADGLEVQRGDTVLLHTGHYRRTFGTPEFIAGWPGIAAEVVPFLAEKGAVAFGVESLGPGVWGGSNGEVHKLCGHLNITHYENLANLEDVVGRGRFRFIAFPLKIRGAAGSPVRAVAVLDEG